MATVRHSQAARQHRLAPARPRLTYSESSQGQRGERDEGEQVAKGNGNTNTLSTLVAHERFSHNITKAKDSPHLTSPQLNSTDNKCRTSRKHKQEVLLRLGETPQLRSCQAAAPGNVVPTPTGTTEIARGIRVCASVCAVRYPFALGQIITQI